MASRPLKHWHCILALSFLLVGCGGNMHASSSKHGKVANSYPSKGKKEHRSAKQGKPGLFIWPIKGPINSPYGERYGRFHDGVDIGGDSGDPIVAAAAGEVVYSDRLGGYGNLVVIKHPNGYFTAYGHNKKNLVEAGTHVKQGQLIAKCGRTGHATGDHLHFEVRDENGTFDPMGFLPRHLYAKGDSRNLMASREEPEEAAPPPSEKGPAKKNEFSDLALEEPLEPLPLKEFHPTVAKEAPRPSKEELELPPQKDPPLPAPKSGVSPPDNSDGNPKENLKENPSDKMRLLSDL